MLFCASVLIRVTIVFFYYSVLRTMRHNVKAVALDTYSMLHDDIGSYPFESQLLYAV